jgi:putative oxidoreductase
MTDLALLIVRLLFGLGLAVHGAQKLFGWYGGYGLEGTGGFFAGLGFRPGKTFALAAGLAEFGGGLLVALGLFGPVGPALMVSVMTVAMLTVHRGKGFLSSNNGSELPLLYVAGAIALARAACGARPPPGPSWPWAPSAEPPTWFCAARMPSRPSPRRRDRGGRLKTGAKSLAP